MHINFLKYGKQQDEINNIKILFIIFFIILQSIINNYLSQSMFK